MKEEDKNKDAWVSHILAQIIRDQVVSQKCQENSGFYINSRFL